MTNELNDEIRYKILQVLYDRASNNTDWKVQRSYLLTKLDYPEKSIDFNLLYLDSRKLAKVVELDTANWNKAIITGEGIDVYEHKLKFVDQYPFIQVAVQNIGAPIYGNAIQSVASQVNITDSFKQAYSLVDQQALPNDQKEIVRSKLEELEKEVKAEKPDKSKLNGLWGWIKTNANWVVPTLKDFIEVILKTTQ